MANCNNADGCCTAAMCAGAGSQLNCVFNDLTTLIKPFAPAINNRITTRQTTLAGSLGNFSTNQLFIFGLFAGIIIFIVEAHKK